MMMMMMMMTMTMTMMMMLIILLHFILSYFEILPRPTPCFVKTAMDLSDACVGVALSGRFATGRMFVSQIPVRMAATATSIQQMPQDTNALVHSVPAMNIPHLRIIYIVR